MIEPLGGTVFRTNEYLESVSVKGFIWEFWKLL